ncbi:MAG: hypothetical protein IJY91_04930 [Oscillospiraceae bacterium]|nr:hypothetical protein [Oscillospiraceae bacterium]
MAEKKKSLKVRKFKNKRLLGAGSRLNRKAYGDVLMLILVGVMAVFSFFPLLMSIGMALKPVNELFYFPPKLLPKKPTLDNFRMLFSLMQNTRVSFFRYAFNTVFISLAVTLGHVFLASMAAYPLAKLKIPGIKLLNTMIMLSLMFVSAVTDVANYLTVSWLGWLDTYWACIIPPMSASLGLFIMRNYMTTIPDSMLEAARIDGCSNFQIFLIDLGAEEVSNLIVQGNGDYKYACTQGYAGEGYYVQKLEAGEGKVFAENAVLDLTYRIATADPLGYVTVESSVDGTNYTACTTFSEATGEGYSNDARKAATVELGGSAGAEAVWVRIKMQHWTSPDGAAVDCSTITASIKDAPAPSATSTLNFAQLSYTGEDMTAVAEAVKALGAEDASNLIASQNDVYKFVSGKGYSGAGYYVQKLEAGEGKVFAENAVLDLTYRIVANDPLGYVEVESSVDGITYTTCTEISEATGNDFYSNDARANATVELNGSAGAEAVWVKVKMEHWAAPAGAAVDCSTVTAPVEDAPADLPTTVTGSLNFAQLSYTGDDKTAVAEAIKALGAEDASNLIASQNDVYKFVSGQGYAGAGYYVQKLEAGEGKVFAENAVLDLTYRIVTNDPLGYVKVESSVDGISYTACTKINEATGNDAYSNDIRANTTVELSGSAGAAAVWVKVTMEHWTAPAGAAVDCSTITAPIEDAPVEVITKVTDTLNFAQLSYTGEDKTAVAEGVKVLGAEDASNLIASQNDVYKFVSGKGYDGEGYYVQKLEAGEGNVFAENAVLDLTYRIATADPLGYVMVESSVDGIYYDVCAEFTEATGDDAYSNDIRANATVELGGTAGAEAVWVKIKMQTWGAPAGAAVDCSTVTAIIEDAPKGLPPVEQWYLELNDNIGINFILNATEEQMASGTVDYTVNGVTNTKNIAELVNEEGKAVLPVELVAAQMSDEVTITLGESTKTYSVRKYAQYILDGDYSTETKNLVKHMLNYGAASQTHFEYNTNRLANTGIEVEAAAVPTEGASVTTSGSVSGVKFYGASLVYRDRIAVRFYFTGDVSGCTFTANGNTCSPVAKDDLYYIEIADILPQDLEQALSVTASDGTSSLSVSYAPKDYIIRMYAKDTNVAPLVQALYGYHLAAEAYTGEVQEAVGQIVPLTYPEEAVTTLTASNLYSFKNRANDTGSYSGFKHIDGTSLAVSPYFTATVEGKTLPVYATPVFVATSDSGALHSFASVDVEFSGREMVSIKLNVSSSVSVSSAQVFGHDEAILTQSGSELTLKVSKHGNYTVVLNDNQAYAVTIMVRSYEDEDAQIAAYQAQYGEDNVMVFEPGLHDISYLQMLSDNMVIYLKAGAILLPEHTMDILSDSDNSSKAEEGASESNGLGLNRHPIINGYNSSNLTIAGRGTVDMTQMDWHERRGIVFAFCNNVTMDGMILINPAEWAFVTYRCENIRVTQSTVLGYRTNSDGFVICNSVDVAVTDCFARTGDDIFVVKTLGGDDTAVSSNNVFSRCQAWGSKARCFGVIGEIEKNVSNIVFEDSIVIFRDATWENDRLASLVVLRESGSGNVNGVTFRDIDIHYDAGRPIIVGIYGDSLQDGTMQNIVFENVSCIAYVPALLCQNSGEHFEVTMNNVSAAGTVMTEDNWTSYVECDGEDMINFQ